MPQVASTSTSLPAPLMKATDKNPVMLLNELLPGLQFQINDKKDSPTTKRFIYTVQVEEET